MNKMEKMANYAVDFMHKHASAFTKVMGHRDDVESEFLYIVASSKAIAERWEDMEEIEHVKIMYRIAKCSTFNVLRSMKRDRLTPMGDEFFLGLSVQSDEYSLVDWRISLMQEIDIFKPSCREAVESMINGGDRPDCWAKRSRIKKSMTDNMYRFQ